MERTYTNLKLRRIKRYRNLKRAKKLFDSLEKNMYDYQKEMIDNPNQYTGVSRERTEYITQKWAKFLKEER